MSPQPEDCLPHAAPSGCPTTRRPLLEHAAPAVSLPPGLVSWTDLFSGPGVDVHVLRSEVSHLAADWLAGAGDNLSVSAWATKNRDTKAVALVTQMVGQLGQAAADSFDRKRWYAANALVRQMVEAYYLMAVLRDDPPQRQRWLDAPTNRIEESFRPGQMRQAAGFQPGEYKQHCEWGGHPNPSARWLLPNHSGKVDPSTLAADLALHLTETVDLFADVLKVIPNADALIAHLPPQADLPKVYREWRDLDPFSKRMQLPPTPADLIRIQNLRSPAAPDPTTASGGAVSSLD